jgi:hypothetical protein
MCEPCGFCGPWQHFIDTCVGGDDYLPSHALVGIDTTLDCVADTNLIMSGPVKVHRSNPHPGTPPDPNDPTHANVIDTEILTMHLTSGGVILTAGAGQGHGGALAASLGQIAESPADPARGESFFDVFFEVDLGGGTYVYNQTALRIQTPVTCIPPFHEYIHVQNCVWLWTSPTPGQGTHVANLVAPNHDAYPFGACCFPDGSCQTTTTEYACMESGGIFEGPGTTCHPNPCTCQHQIDLWDCYGDGWNGNTLDVKVNGNLVLSGITLASGYGPATYYFMAATGDTIQTIYHPIGGWPYEPYYYIYDGVGNLLGSDGISGTNCWVQPTGITVTGNCAPLPLGACCFADAHCEDLTQLDCANAGGTWGQGQQCSLNPCGACCAPGECGESTEFDCTMAGADWMGAGTTCDPNPCVGACCYPEGYCEVTPQEQCTGIWLGGGTTCSPNMCEPCADCGPWPHFIDTCAAGNDYLPSAALVGIDTDLDPDCTADINLIMHGPVKVHRSAPLDDSVNFPGTRPLDGHLDVIDTEILMMHLTGLGGIVLTAGGGQGQGAVLAPSLGRIAEYYSDPAVGDSFFDVFFEVDLGGGNYAYNHTALKVQTRVTCIPPYQEYIHVLDCIELYDSPTGGTHIANLVAPIHDAYPFGACCFPDGSCQTTTTEWACQAAGGEFQGFGTLCHPNPCPQPLGACCYPDGSCTIVPENQCSGIWLGEGTSCIHCEPCAFCGPGPHFIDTCAGGDDALPSSALVGIDTTLNCVPETSLVMFGPVKVHRGNPYAGPPPNDPNHPNRIDTEIVSMHLTGGGGGGGGVILIAGAGLGQGGVLAASLGRMTELPSNPAMADSFFDVFFEVDLGGGNYVYNQTALRVQTLITCIPPYHEYIHVQNCVQLWTSPTVGQGIHVANLVAPDHDAYPFGGACCFPDGSCQTTSVDICQMAGGEWKGAGTTCHPNPCICLGDVNCDGVVNFGDINPFVLFLSNFPLWQQTYQGCPWQNGDINGDGTYGTGSFGDINPFVALIVQSPILCP